MTVIKTPLYSPYPMEQHREEIEPFVEWLSSRDVHVVLEIGVRYGGTAALWCGLGFETVIGVDYGGPDSLGEIETKRLALEMESKYSNYRFICGNSHDPITYSTVKDTLHERTKVHGIDLLFLDGDHSYQGVKQDFDNYRDLMSIGGVIALHDIADTPFMRSTGHGVHTFWKEIDSPKIEFCINADWGGIGVVLL